MTDQTHPPLPEPTKVPVVTEEQMKPADPETLKIPTPEQALATIKKEVARKYG